MSSCPRLIFSALRGGAGKSTIAIGVARALRANGRKVMAFKKGPDYIDAGWLTLATGRPCRNLDTFFMPAESVLESFYTHARKADIVLVEGNRGLYDGIDIEGATSTAEIAKLLSAPVILCLDCTKTTRTSAAVVSGCMAFDPDIQIAGVVLNRVAGHRHENILRRSIEHYCGLPVLGAIPKLTEDDFPERHMGLVPTPEHGWAQQSVRSAGEMAERYLDLPALEAVARTSNTEISPAIDTHPAIDTQRTEAIRKSAEAPTTGGPVIAVARDAAFQFYYEENLEALARSGANLCFVSPMADPHLPARVDGLYLGGGFPETQARQLSENRSFRGELAELVEKGLPVYAECGGLIYLGHELILDEQSYPMCRILPVTFDIADKPAGHGYTISRVERENPFFPVGTELRGHEFRYSRVLDWQGADEDLVLSTLRGKGFVNRRDGICYKNVLAGYAHLHALGTPGWAPAFVRRARLFQQKKAG